MSRQIQVTFRGGLRILRALTHVLATARISYTTEIMRTDGRPIRRETHLVTDVCLRRPGRPCGRPDHDHSAENTAEPVRVTAVRVRRRRGSDFGIV